MGTKLARTGSTGVWWLLTYALLWYLLAGGDGWLFAAPVILAGAGLSWWLQLHPIKFHVLQGPQFAGFFLRAMVTGALDVARRALHPRRPIQPGWILYSMKSSDPRVQLLCTALIGLLPGTLVVRTDLAPSGAHQLHLHVLDASQAHDQTLAALELSLEKLLVPVEASQ